MGSRTRKDSILSVSCIRNVFLLALGILHFLQTPALTKLVRPLRVDESFFIAAYNMQAKMNGKEEQKNAQGLPEAKPHPGGDHLDAASWQSTIDIFIGWAPPAVAVEGQDVTRERSNGELPYLLRSVAKNAPWVRRIWIAVDGPEPLPNVDVPPSLANRTTVIDRCTFMPEGFCPTRNSHAVASFAHRLEGLSEHFIVVEDDIFLGRPVTPDFFFNDGKPHVWRKKPTWGFFAGQAAHRIYKDPSVVNFSTPKSSAPSPHFWYPQLKSICASMEAQYPAFYAFVGSHIEGRYSSLAKGISDKDNSQEECLFGWMNWELLRTGAGVFKSINAKRYEWWDEVVISERGFEKAVRDRAIFMNINDRFSKDQKEYKKQVKWFEGAMDTMFPADF